MKRHSAPAQEEQRARRAASRPYFESFYRGNRLRWATVMLLTVLTVPANLIASWLLGEIIDVMGAGDMGLLRRIAWLTVLFIAGFFVLEMLRQRIKAVFVHRALAQYKSFAFRRLSQKGISAFKRESTGRYISVLTNDVNTVEENYLNRTFNLVYYALLFVGTLVMMLCLSLPLAAAAIALSLLSIVVSGLLGGEMTRRETAVSDQNERFVSRVRELLSGFSVIKSFKAERQAQRLFDESSAQTERCKLARRWWDCVLLAVGQNLCGEVLQMGIFLLGAYLAIRSRITAGTAIIFTNLCNFLIAPIGVVPQYWAGRKAAKGLVEKLAALAGENTGHAGEPIPPRLEDAICIRNLSFGYEPGQPVLRDINLRLEAGKRYALVGGSGSGKSTLLSLLMGAHEGYEGDITIDGRELRSVCPDSLYDLISLIDQHVFLFDDTLRSNITMFSDFPEEAVETAIRRSGLSALVSARGADYRCGEDGVGLSGGERQRVSIARCLLRGTPVLLLDEATAALDNRTAFEVTDAILHLDGLLRLVVTHRLESALLRQYDGIIVLRGGRVEELGSFDELMARKGYFYSLYTVTAQ